MREITNEYFKKRRLFRSKILERYSLLENVYESIGISQLSEIAKLQQQLSEPKVKISLLKEVGLVVARIKMELDDKVLPSYSLSNTSVQLDHLIKDMREIITIMVEVAESDHKLYLIGQEYLKIQRRINALEDIIMPRLNKDIKAIEEILEDNEREEFIAMKHIKEQIGNE